MFCFILNILRKFYVCRHISDKCFTHCYRRPDVYIAMAGVLEARDKHQYKQNLGYELQARIRGIVSLFLKQRLGHWWQINSSAVTKILAGLRDHNSKIPSVQGRSGLHVLVSKLAIKLFQVPDKEAQVYLVHDLLDILQSNDSNYLDKFEACLAFSHCSCHLGPLHEECLTSLKDIVIKTETELQQRQGHMLHQAAANSYEFLSRMTLASRD